MHSDNDPSLAAALEALDRGWTPTPLHPRLKRPLLHDWVSTRWDSPEALRSTWSASSRDDDDTHLNLGLALGARHGGLVDIDIDHPKALALAAQLLPRTSMRSGRLRNPGSHFWYVVEGVDPGIRQFKLPDGQVIVEYRAGGGQTVIPPSLHPDGDEYRWEGEAWGGEEGPTRLDDKGAERLLATTMAIALIVVLADNWPTRGDRHSAYLPLVGGLLRDADEDGQPRCHPMWDQNIESIVTALVVTTNDSDGARNRIAESVSSTRRKILRGEKVQGWPTLAKIIGEEHVRRAREIVEAAEELDGTPRARLPRGEEGWDEGPGLRVVDHEPVAKTPEERDLQVALLDDAERDPLAERLNQWEPLDLGPYLRGGAKPTPPALLTRNDGAGLIYPGRVNSLFGEGGSGKTLIALDIVASEVRAGRSVLFVDFEDEPVNMISRMHALGLSDQQITEHILYVHPEGHPLSAMHVDRWGQALPPLGRRAQDETLTRLLDERDPSLVVVDGTTSLYRIHGLDTNGVQGTDLVGGWLRGLTNGNRRTVLLIDHTSKNAGSESGPIGSQHKIAMIQGVALRVKASVRPRPGAKGEATLLVLKDRLGMVLEKSNEADTPIAAEVTFDSTDLDAGLRISYEAPNASSTPGVRIVTDDRDALLLDALRARASSDLDDPESWWMKPEQIRTAAGVIFDSTERNMQAQLLQRLIDKGKVEHSGKRGLGSRYRATRYSLGLPDDQP